MREEIYGTNQLQSICWFYYSIVWGQNLWSVFDHFNGTHFGQYYFQENMGQTCSVKTTTEENTRMQKESTQDRKMSELAMSSTEQIQKTSG